MKALDGEKITEVRTLELYASTRLIGALVARLEGVCFAFSGGTGATCPRTDTSTVGRRLSAKRSSDQRGFAHRTPQALSRALAGALFACSLALARRAGQLVYATASSLGGGRSRGASPSSKESQRSHRSTRDAGPRGCRGARPQGDRDRGPRCTKRRLPAALRRADGWR